MKITLSKKNLTAILKAANAIIPRKSNLPVLQFLRFETIDEHRVSVTATDLEQTLVVTIMPETLETDGNKSPFLFPVSELKELKKSMKKPDLVTLTPANENGVSLNLATPTGDLARNVGTMSVDEFPEPPEDVELTECDAGVFIEAYRRAAFAVSTDITRGALTGVYADIDNGCLVGTDGRRLSRLTIANFPLKAAAIIPVTKALTRLFPEKGDGQVGISENGGDGVFEIQVDNLRYVARCVPGTYPAYDRVIPADTEEFKTTLTFSDTDLDTLGTILPHLKQDSNHGLFITGHGDRAAIGMESDENGCCAVLLPECRFESAEDMTVAVNASLLEEALKNGFRTMAVKDSRIPMRFSDDRDGLHLIMPLREDPSDAMQQEFQKLLASAPAHQPATQETHKPEPAASKPKEKTKMSDNNQNPPATETKPDLHVVKDQDPVEQLETLADQAVEAVKQANTAVRDLKKQIRTVKSHYKNRDKELTAREKDMAKSLTLLNKLQDSLAA